MKAQIQIYSTVPHLSGPTKWGSGWSVWRHLTQTSAETTASAPARKSHYHGGTPLKTRAFSWERREWPRSLSPTRGYPWEQDREKERGKFDTYPNSDVLLRSFHMRYESRSTCVTTINNTLKVKISRLYRVKQSQRLLHNRYNLRNKNFCESI